MTIECEKKLALRIKVEVDGNNDVYAKSFLAIYNNVKCDQDLLKVYNDYGNGVYVVCESHVKDAAIQFLEQFGTIASIDTIEVVTPLAYDYNYRDDIDTEFLAVEEI